MIVIHLLSYAVRPAPLLSEAHLDGGLSCICFDMRAEGQVRTWELCATGGGVELHHNGEATEREIRSFADISLKPWKDSL